MTRLQQIHQFERINRKFELRFEPKVYAALNAVRKHVVRLLKDKGYSAAQYYLTTNVGNPRMRAVIREIYVSVGRRWAQIEYSRLLPETRAGKKTITVTVDKSVADFFEMDYVVASGSGTAQKGFGFNYQWTEFILKYLEKYLFEKVTFEIARTTQDAMLKVISRGIAAGWSIDQTVDRLEEWPFLRYQAARIVRTETNRAANVGSTAQAETSEYEQMKEWQSAEDHRVRGKNPKDHADHVALDGVKINAGDVFHDPRNGDQLQFPGDPLASAASVINCRCHASYTFKRDQAGNLIPKRKTTVVIFPGQVRQRRTVTI